MELNPYRLCCGKQHSGPMCPDGLVMCCLCFDRFPLEQLSRTINDEPIDICQVCAAEELDQLGREVRRLRDALDHTPDGWKTYYARKDKWQ